MVRASVTDSHLFRGRDVRIDVALPTVSERRKWKIETRPATTHGMKGEVFQEHLELSQSWMAELVRRGTFTDEEGAALRDPRWRRLLGTCRESIRTATDHRSRG